MPKIKEREDLKLLAGDRRQRGNPVESFIIMHAIDYTPSLANKNAIVGYLRREKLDVTLANLNRAYTVLKVEGKLDGCKADTGFPAIDLAIDHAQEFADNAWASIKKDIDSKTPLPANAAVNPNALPEAKPTDVGAVGQGVMAPPSVRTVRPLSVDEVLNMDEDDRAWHFTNNTENWRAAITRASEA
jgi:hypothetical protein